jgi:hypothetical protein
MASIRGGYGFCRFTLFCIRVVKGDHELIRVKTILLYFPFTFSFYEKVCLYPSFCLFEKVIVAGA